MLISLDQALQVLRTHQRQLEDAWVIHAYVFGSTARGEANEESDLDILIDVKEIPSVFAYVGLKNFVGDLFDVKTDVVLRDGLKPYVRENVLKDPVRAF